MWHLREQVSHLVEAGHADAPSYPIAMVFDEVSIVVHRENLRLATEGAILQSAANTAVAAFGKDGGSKARKAFNALLNKLTGKTGSGSGPKPLPDHLKKGLIRDGDKKPNS